MTATMIQRQEALVTANETRSAAAAWRKAIKSGDASLGDVFEERPDCLTDKSILELFAYRPQWGPEIITRINHWAVRCGINLAVPLGKADDATIDWAYRALRKPKAARWEDIFGKDGIDLRTAATTATRLSIKAQGIAVEMGEAIERHRVEIQDPEVNADVAKADAALWLTADLAKELK
jgi:hypothetical protein